MTIELTLLGATELAQRIHRRQISPLEAVDAHIKQIEKVNPAINALVTPTFDQAHREARRATDRLMHKSADLPPLFGVPITIKDALPVADVRFTAGSTFYRDHIASEDAEAVRRFKAAGAIILGKTNCSDMSGSPETSNLIFGLTRNPWNLNHSAGGSSGGEGALIAAGASPLGLGSDIGGSIRIPAAFCGVAGLKPSAGRIPTTGHIPNAPAAVGGWNTVGPLARRVADLAVALSVLSDEPGLDHTVISVKMRRIIVPDFFLFPSVSREINAAIQKATEALKHAGMEVIQHVKLPMLKVLFEFASLMYREWLPHYRRALGGGQAAKFWPELIANIRGKGRVSTTCLPFFVASGLVGPVSRLFGYGRFDQLAKLRHRILEAMGSGGLLLWPIFPTTAPKHGFVWRPSKQVSYTAVFNSLGFPAVAVPLGLSTGNLPLSVQIVGRPGEDETALAAAAALEREFGGWQIAVGPH